jgi:hypothetical protein
LASSSFKMPCLPESSSTICHQVDAGALDQSSFPTQISITATRLVQSFNLIR